MGGGGRCIFISAKNIQHKCCSDSFPKLHQKNWKDIFCMQFVPISIEEHCVLLIVYPYSQLELSACDKTSLKKNKKKLGERLVQWGKRQHVTQSLTDWLFFSCSAYDLDEVLTYDEVMLVEPHPEKRRPIVIVGECLFFLVWNFLRFAALTAQKHRLKCAVHPCGHASHSVLSIYGHAGHNVLFIHGHASLCLASSASLCYCIGTLTSN